MGYGPDPRLVVDEAQPFQVDHRLARGDLQVGGDGGVRRQHLGRAYLAAQVAAPGGDVLEEPGEGLHQPSSGLRMRDEGAPALHPLDDALVLQVGQGLPDDRTGDVLLGAQLVVAEQAVARLAAAPLDVPNNQLLELVIHRQRRAAVDPVTCLLS
ncbi:hypothetical protein R6Y94_07310 [Plantactinospora sp. KLBMP9567]|nr:hypothetical protein [Plantactinospora sp. KLBMP9567]MDW5323646.1 hypothetical protein [Plantactinospora sp. KLBMP9567]